ncbi:MAG: lamin tail domain-containing protein, partial [Candidatus Thermoplasmatota archaeon]|nr:lamin tail domain-containing protein [Candidatus Thermoplasmatota archaeon]
MSRLATFITVFLLLSILFAPQGLSEDSASSESSDSNMIISEVLASPNGMKNNETCSNCYNATDWNGDGEYGKFSDQFIELYNPTDQPINISNWVLDDIADGGSAPCQLARNTIVQPGDYVSIFINASRIELDYYGGDTVNLYDETGTLVDSLSYPDKDSWYGNSYIPLENGSIWKVRPPTPGYSQNESFGAAQNMIGCFGMSDGGYVESMLLKGRVVTMNSESDVINDGSV